MNQINIPEAVTVCSGIAAAIVTGSISNKSGNRKIITAGYALSAFALGFAATEIVLRKTTLKEDNGWDGLGSVIFIIAGGILLSTTIFAGYIVGKKQ